MDQSLIHPPLLGVEDSMCCRGGLEGRLLGLALQAEQPQLEAQRAALLQQEEEQRLQLAALDTHLLQSLATSKVLACFFPLAFNMRTMLVETTHTLNLHASLPATCIHTHQADNLIVQRHALLCLIVQLAQLDLSLQGICIK